MTTERSVETEREVLEFGAETTEDSDTEVVEEPIADTSEEASAPPDVESPPPPVSTESPVSQETGFTPEQSQTQNQNVEALNLQRELDRYRQQAAMEAVYQSHAEDRSKYQRMLEEQGYAPEQVQTQVSAMAAQQKSDLEQQYYLYRLEKAAEEREQNYLAKTLVVEKINQETGIPISRLMKSKNMDELKIMMKEYQLDQKIKALTPVTSPDNSVPSSSASLSRERRMDQLMSKDELTDNEHAELGRLTGNR